MPFTSSSNSKNIGVSAFHPNCSGALSSPLHVHWTTVLSPTVHQNCLLHYSALEYCPLCYNAPEYCPLCYNALEHCPLHCSRRALCPPLAPIQKNIGVSTFQCCPCGIAECTAPVLHMQWTRVVCSTGQVAEKSTIIHCCTCVGEEHSSLLHVQQRSRALFSATRAAVESGHFNVF